jgi:hypothetical protein
VGYSRRDPVCAHAGYCYDSSRSRLGQMAMVMNGAA